jgi:hypothetical protein
MSIEAMKLALEALEDWNSPLDPQPDEDIITALRQAIEQDKKELKATERQVEILTDELANAQRRIEQFEQAQKQEPHGYLYKTGKFYHEVEGCNPMTDKRYLPLYTSPPQHQPLTDEQIEREWQFLHDEEGNPPDHHDFARAIEAAHKIGVEK